MIDFNACTTPSSQESTARDEIRAELLARLPAVLSTLFPAGTIRRHRFVIGNVEGQAGDSLEVVLSGEKTGLWTDYATGEGGDLFDLIAATRGLDTRSQFKEVLGAANDLLGRATPIAVPPTWRTKAMPPMDQLGPPTGKWYYHDSEGNLIAVVYRYELSPGKKEFRPWDVKRRKASAPTPRPLYNQPGLLSASQVILVEGEKCAEVLIGMGYAATTAMHGANAPVDKTDWTPLRDKRVVIWPDHDTPGQEYAERAAQAILQSGAVACEVLRPPKDSPLGWDVADAVLEGFDIGGFLNTAERFTVEANDTTALPPNLFDGLKWHTEHGLAKAFIRQYSQDWRYCAGWGKWLSWKSARWCPDERLYISHLVREVCSAASDKATARPLMAKLASGSTFAAVERILRTDPTLASAADEWDADVWLLNTPGGVVDLRTGLLREHRRRDHFTKITVATPQGDSPAWQAFLQDISGSDTQLISYLQRMVGYCLTGVTHEHALFFLFGTGANGKSVFLNVLSTILGDYAAHAPMDAFMETRSERHPTELAGLRGARFVSSLETEQGRRWNESKIKSITGGDKISARFMRQDFFEYTPQFKLLIAGNHKPSIRNVDEAMRRRLHLIPFTVTIPSEKRDKQLTAKLLEERNGILAWAIEGCLAWQRDGFHLPAQVVTATEEYFEGEDALGRWLEERCIIATSHRTKVSALFADWREWAENAGEYVGSVRRFSDLLTTRQFERCRLPDSSRGLRGIALQPKTSGLAYPYRDD